jgi:hypothetical protein
VRGRVLGERAGGRCERGLLGWDGRAPWGC